MIFTSRQTGFPVDVYICGICGNHHKTRGEADQCCWAVKNQAAPSPLQQQIGGDHYRKRAIQPIQFILANGLGFCEGNVVKYVTRWKDKGGLADLKKARHYLDFLIEQEESGMCSTPSGTTLSDTGD